MGAVKYLTGLLGLFLVCNITLLTQVHCARKAATPKPSAKLVATTSKTSKEPQMKMLFYNKCIQPQKIPALKDMAAKASAECLPTEATKTIENSPGATVYRNPCSMVCYLQKHGFTTKLKNGSYSFDIPGIQTFMATNLIPGAKEGFDKDLKECLQKKGLSTSFTVNTNDKCLGSKSHIQCFVKATEKSCKAILSKTNPSNKSNRQS